MQHQRIQELDDIKSSLVLIMLAFHSASGLTRYAGQLESVYSCLYFIHFAFVLVTGLLCGIHYHKEALNSPWKVRLRLWRRGGKLLALFLAMNALLYAAGVMKWSKMAQYFADGGGLWQMLAGGIPGSLAAFEILYPIAVFLLLIPFLIPWMRDWALILLGLGLMFRDDSALLFCLAWGALGMGLGMSANRPAVLRVLHFLRERLFVFPILLAAILIAKNSWHIDMDLRGKLLLLLETLAWFGTFIWVLRFHDCGRYLRLMGGYTLAAYIGQMIIIVGLNFVMRRLALGVWPSYIVMLVSASAVTWGAMLLLEWLRRRIHWINRSYQFIFT